MPTPGGPTDSLLRIFADVRDHLREIGAPPDWVPEFLEVHVKGHSRPITLLVPPAGPAPVAAPPPGDPPSPTPYQERILDALAGKCLTADQLAEKVGDRRRLFRDGGVKDLVTAGLVKKRQGHGYYATDDPPDEFSDESE
jgi:hypothetical protein